MKRVIGNVLFMSVGDTYYESVDLNRFVVTELREMSEGGID
jgi:hypothetical protein